MTTSAKNKNSSIRSTTASILMFLIFGVFVSFQEQSFSLALYLERGKKGFGDPGVFRVPTKPPKLLFSPENSAPP